MKFYKKTEIDFNIDDFINQLTTYDYSKSNIEMELACYIDDLVQNESIIYSMLDFNDREKILIETIERLKNKSFSKEQLEDIETDIKKYNNKIEVYQKKIEELEKMLKENK